jgi:hypothetical protein
MALADSGIQAAFGTVANVIDSLSKAGTTSPMGVFRISKFFHRSKQKLLIKFFHKNAFKKTLERIEKVLKNNSSGDTISLSRSGAQENGSS